MARRFFQNYELSADITRLNKNLITKWWVICQALSSKYQIKTTNFNEYCTDTAKMVVEKYGWYYMPASVIANMNIPIGQLSEEAQE